MIELADKLAEMIQSGNILWLAAIAVVAFVMKLSKVLEFFEIRKKAQIARLIEALNCEQLDESFKEFLSHEIQREYFLYVSRIAAEKQYRDKLFEVHRESNGNLPFFHFRRASSHLKYDDGTLSVKITKYDVFSSVASLVLTLFFGFVGLAMFMMPAFIEPIAFIQAITFYGIGAFFVMMAVFFSVQTLPLYSAKLIKKQIEKSHNNSIQPTADAAAD